MARAVVCSVTLALIVIGVALAGVAAGQPAQVRSTIKVEGMQCDGCEATIMGTLERIDGVIEATADHEGGLVEVVYRPSEVSADRLTAAISKLGNTVVSVTTRPVED